MDESQCYCIFTTVLVLSVIMAIHGFSVRELNSVVPRVESGTLYTLEWDKVTSAVTYNLSAAVSFSNVDTNNAVPLSELVAAPFYGGEQLGMDTRLPSVQLPPGMATTLAPLVAVQGRQAVGAKVARTYTDDADLGYFTVDVRIEVLLGVLDHQDRYYFLCTLFFQAPSPHGDGGAPNLFDGDECMSVRPDTV